MNDEEIAAIMALPKKAGLVPKYKRIWKTATGSDFNDCLCGGGFERLYRLCVNYNNKINGNRSNN